VDMPCETAPSGTVRPHWLGIPLIESSDSQFWANIYSTEITSSECLPKIWSLFSCPSKIAVARSFQGNEAQTFIDFMDRVSKSRAPCLGNLLISPRASNAGARTAMPRRQTPAAMSAASFQDLQSTQYRTHLIYSSTGTHTCREGLPPRWIRRCERWRILGTPCGRQTSQDGG
jgi:hypothetical protein